MNFFLCWTYVGLWGRHVCLRARCYSAQLQANMKIEPITVG